MVSDGLDRGLAYAECCFETFRVVDGAIFSWPEHMARLQRGLAEFGLSLTEEQLAEAKAASLQAAAAYGCDALVRLTVTGGKSSWGLMARGESPVIYLQVMPGSRSPDPLRLRLKQWPFPPKARPAKFSADYADTLRALQGEPDANTLFFREGLLLGAATANLLLYRDGQWWTPRLAAGVLPGVVRGHLLKQGVVGEAECPIGWLAECSAVAVCNSGLFVRPASMIDYGEAGEMRYDPVHQALSSFLETFAGMAGVPQGLS